LLSSVPRTVPCSAIPQPCQSSNLRISHTSHPVANTNSHNSRIDAYFGNPQPFNPLVFAETRSHWPTPVINVTQAAAARWARVLTSNATNPTFSLSARGEAFGFGESAAYIIVLGDKTSGTVRREVVEYLFGEFSALVSSGLPDLERGSPLGHRDTLLTLFPENERLPTELGWSRSADNLTEQDLGDVSGQIILATPYRGNWTYAAQVAGSTSKMRRGFH
jgi:hypothetical protein